MGVGVQQRFEAVLEVFSGAALLIDDEGRYREVFGNGDEELLVAEKAALEGRRFEEVLPADLADRFHEIVGRVLATGSPEVVEYELTVEAGDRWFEASVSPIEGDHDRVIWLARDVTERKRFEQALAALHDAGTRITTTESIEAACAEALDAAESVLAFDQSIVALESDGMLEAEVTSQKLPADAVTTIPVEEGIAGETYRTGESALLEDIRDHGAARQEHAFRSGISVPIGDHGNFQAVAEEPGEFDETDLELAELLIGQLEATLTRFEHEQELRRRNERLDEFASIVSHDLRNPLTVANGRLELVREECDSDELDAVADAHDRMETLIDGLLAIARSGSDANDVEPVRLKEIVRQCWRVVDSEDARLVVAGEGTITAHPNQLQQLLENLLANAVEHGGRRTSGSGGDGVTVTVGTFDGGFYVEDDGPGLPDGDPERLFDRGVSSAGGNGFGLYIVETVAESHGWTVSAMDAADAGARFEITGVDSASE